MSTKQRKPQWWQLYIMLPVLAGLFVLEIRLGLKGAANILAQLGILFLIYGFMQSWVRANRSALMGMDEQPGEWRLNVYKLTPARSIERRPLVQLPENERSGLDARFEPNTSSRRGFQSIPAERLLHVEETKDVHA